MQAEKEVFGVDHGAPELAGFAACEEDDVAGHFGVALEHCGVVYALRTDGSNRPVSRANRRKDAALAVVLKTAYLSTREPSMKRERLQRITVEAGKCGGRPCIRGLRIRVADILELLSAGASFDEILKDYPFLEREDISAALDYAAYQTDHAVLQTS